MQAEKMILWKLWLPVSNANQITAATKAAACLQEDFPFSTNIGKDFLFTRLHRANLTAENVSVNSVIIPVICLSAAPRIT